MLAFLVAIRDLILAAALAWIGFTLETRSVEQTCANAAQSCERDR